MSQFQSIITFKKAITIVSTNCVVFTQPISPDWSNFFWVATSGIRQQTTRPLRPRLIWQPMGFLVKTKSSAYAAVYRTLSMALVKATPLDPWSRSLDRRLIRNQINDRPHTAARTNKISRPSRPFWRIAFKIFSQHGGQGQPCFPQSFSSTK